MQRTRRVNYGYPFLWICKPLSKTLHAKSSKLDFAKCTAKLWNSFSASEKEIDRLVKEIEAIAEEYIKKIPYSEDSYLVRARVYQTVKDDPDKELEILNECLEKIKVCSRVALRCADIYFERGEYAKALERVQRALADANKTQGSINEGYGYYLAGLCKIAMLPKEKYSIEKEKPLHVHILLGIFFKIL